MMKNMIFTLALFTILFTSCNSKEYDTRAVKSLDAMTSVIGELKACSYTLHTIIANDSIEVNNMSDAYMRGPDKLYVHTVGTVGERGFWYNGKSFAYFSYNKNEYDIIDAPNNILKLIDTINETYGIEFPAADFFYPSLTDDILENYNSVLFTGDEVIDGVNCVTIEASNSEETLQIWIEKTTNLPHRMVMESKTNKNEFYDVVFSNWRINQNLPDLLFEFQASESSTLVKFQSKH
jgi:hypothetical protein